MITEMFLGLAGPVLFLALTAGASDTLDSVGARFHRETSFDQFGFVGKKPTFGREQPPYKKYSDAVVTELPPPPPLQESLGDAIADRRSVREFISSPLSLEQLSTVLAAAASLTHTRDGYAFRTAPSGGALYPIEIYLLVHNVDSLAPGLYHYQVADSSLETISTGDFSDRIHQASNRQETVGRSPATLVLTARWERITVKYADRGYRYAYMECGAICQNIYLAATAMGLGTCAVGAFDDEDLNEFLGIEPSQEAALLIMPLGHPRR
jgi:SagB-type dehydrogenase family enzyme